MQHFERQFPEELGNMDLEGRVPFGAAEEDLLCPRGPNHFQIHFHELSEGGLITAPQGVVTAAPLVIAYDRLDAHAIEQPQDTAGNFDTPFPRLENRLEEGRAAHEEEDVSR